MYVQYSGGEQRSTQFFQDISQILKATGCNGILCLLEFIRLRILLLAVLVTQNGSKGLT
jgi:hypothetical protein